MADSENAAGNVDFLSGAIVFDPSGAVADDGAGTGTGTGTGTGIGTGTGTGTGAKRGRKPGSRNGTSAKTAPSDLTSVSDLLLLLHGAIAVVSKNPVWELDKSESDKLADGFERVARHHNIKIAGKYADYVFLGTAMFNVYAPRIATIAMTKNKAVENNSPPMEAPQARVFDINQPWNGAA